MRPSRLIIVDDDPGMLRAVTRILSEGHEVRSYRSAREALNEARGFQPDLALVDVRMPEMDGFVLTQELKSLDPDLEVILMTGSVFEVDEQLIRAIREKAFYYITKPFDRAVLRTLVERALELVHLERERKRHLLRLERELAEAEAFQKTMLPPSEARLSGFKINATHRPCRELAGDLFDYAAVGKGGVAVLIADVVGHGVSAAMMTALVKSAFHAARDDEYAPAAIVRRVHESVRAFGPDRFVTLIAARILSDGDSGTLEFVNAGHLGGLLRTAARGVESLPAGGPIISPVFPVVLWETGTLRWQGDSELFLFTDGIPETAHHGEEFGVERIEQLLDQGPARDPGLVARIDDAVNRFAPHAGAEDDITCVHVFESSTDA